MLTTWLLAQCVALVVSLALGSQLSQPTSGTIALVAIGLALLIPAAPTLFRALRRALPGAVRAPARCAVPASPAPGRRAGAPGTRGTVRARAPSSVTA